MHRCDYGRLGRIMPSLGSRKTLVLSLINGKVPVIDKTTFQSTLDKVFFGGDAAFGPENIITAVAHGHQAAISIDLYVKRRNIN